MNYNDFDKTGVASDAAWLFLIIVLWRIRMENKKSVTRGFQPGVDNERIVSKLVAITSQGEKHAKVRQSKDGKLVISIVSEKLVS